SYGSAPATPRERVYVSRAADDPPESAPPAGCTRKSRPDPGIDRASSPSRRITAGKVNHRPFALASFFSKLLDLFWIGPDGGIGIKSWNDGSWGDPWQLVPPNSAVAGALAASSRHPSNLDLFWIGPDGGIGIKSWNDGSWGD